MYRDIIDVGIGLLYVPRRYTPAYFAYRCNVLPHALSALAYYSPTHDS